MDFINKQVAVLGIGIEGTSVLDFLLKHKAHVTIFDKKPFSSLDLDMQKRVKKNKIKFVNNEHADLTTFDVIFRSPGIHPERKNLTDARKKGVNITSATKTFFDLCPCPIIGVTGTKGKGTTSSLIYEMLKKEGFDAYLGGNIGMPPLEFLDKLNPNSKVVLELSSFQLMDLGYSPHIAVMLMTTSEHLDYHKDVYEYVGAKRNIFRLQTSADYAIMNRDYPASNESDVESNGKIYKVSREQEFPQGCFVRGDAIILKTDAQEKEIIKTKDILLPGRHNLENACAAVIAASFGGAKIKTITHVLKTFKGLEHRLEVVRTVGGVRYYDDSFSTTPETAIAAIEAFTEPEILLLGGSSKNSDFTELGNVITNAKNIKAIIKIGEEWERIKDRIKNQESRIEVIENCETMESAVKKAKEIATLGDVVLLTPACASFDRYKNYKDRGEQFKKEVFSLNIV